MAGAVGGPGEECVMQNSDRQNASMGTGPTVGKSAIHWSTFFGEQFDSIFLTEKCIFIDLEIPV